MTSNDMQMKVTGTTIFRAVLVGLVSLSVIGCSDLRRAIGDEKSSPDEFEVVVRAPLSLPPGFSDRPEDIAKTQDEAVGVDSQTQASVVLGASSQSSLTGYDALFNFASVPDNIREIVDQETLGIQFERRLPIQVLFGGVPDIGPVLDKISEDQRIRRNKRDGLLPNEGDILARDAQSQETIIIKQ